MPTFTPILNLTKPDGGETNWTSQMNGNLDALDTFSQFPLGRANVVTYSSTPTFDLSRSTLQIITLTGDVSSATFSNPRDGQLYTIVIVQDAVGGRSFSFPSTFKGAGQVSPTVGNAPANGVSVQSFHYVESLTAYVPVGAMISF